MSNYQYSQRVFRIDKFDYDNNFIYSIIAFSILFFIIKKLGNKKYILAIVNIIFIILLIIIIKLNVNLIPQSNYQHLIVAFGLITPFSVLLLRYGMSIKKLSGIVEVSLFAFMPFIFVVGTGNNYWWLSGLVSIFYVAIGLYIFPINLGPSVFFRQTLAFSFIIQLFSANMILVGSTYPYYQTEPLKDMRSSVIEAARLQSIKMSEANATYLEQVFKILNANQFKSKTPVIDLTGHSPGLLYAIDAISLGLPWIQGNYSAIDPNLNFSGANNVATRVIGGEDCSLLEKAWVISEPQGLVSLPENIIFQLGLTLDQDYEMVGVVEVPKGVGGPVGGSKQFIYKPNFRGKLNQNLKCIKKSN